MKKKWTGERLERFVLTRDTVDHLHRYGIASNYVDGKIVLDIASGEGYGSSLLSKKAQKVIAVDIDMDTIENAKKNYVASNLQFLHGSASEIPLEDNSVDVVVSFETIEHHEHHDEMMREIKRVLRKDGLLIMSSPDKEMYSDRRSFKNPFHVKELYKNEFEQLIQSYFSNAQFLLQSFVNGNSIILGTDDSESALTFIGTYNFVECEKTSHMYIVALASNSEFEKQNFSIFDGSKILAGELENFKKGFYRSNSYKLGHFILSPFKTVKRIFK